MTYNILDGALGREHSILSVLQTAQPDILVLQEVTELTVVENFAQILGMNLFFAEGNSNRHLALLTRLPIISQRSYHPFPMRTTILEAVIEYSLGRQLHLFGVHLQAFPLLFFEWHRRWEIQIILREVIKHQTEPCLIAGDFNTLAPTDKIDRSTLPHKLKLMFAIQGETLFHSTISSVLKARFTDCYRTLNKEAGYTLPTPKPNTRLDYIFANNMMRQGLCDCYVITEPDIVNKASDHYPVMAEFRLC